MIPFVGSVSRIDTPTRPNADWWSQGAAGDGRRVRCGGGESISDPHRDGSCTIL